MKYSGLDPLRKEGSSSVLAFMCTPVALGTVRGWLLMIWTFPGRVGDGEVSFLSSCWHWVKQHSQEDPKLQETMPSHLLGSAFFSFLTDIAKICQSNLRKNFMYGGRRHLPFPVELEALLVLTGRGVGMLGREGGQRLGRRCQVKHCYIWKKWEARAVTVPRKDIRHVSIREMPWSRQGCGRGRVRYCGQAVGG